MDKYLIDNHKLIYHVSRVNDWLQGYPIYPIYMEISPSGACNHRCTFCALDYMEYQERFLDAALLADRLSEMGRLGLKSIMYAGEGEPLLHRNMVDIIKKTHVSGIDAALTTNGVLLTESLAEKILGHLKWIKVSINAATGKTYSKIHRTHRSDLDKVLQNMSAAAVLKRKHGHECTLGLQLLLLPENKDEVLLLAKTAKEIGMDYLVVKPYSQHLLSKTERYKNIRYEDVRFLAGELAKFDDDGFNTIFRTNTINTWDQGLKNYSQCLSLPFWSYIDAGGNVWGCSAYLGDERFLFGNIKTSSFQEIWEGEVRRRFNNGTQKIESSQCRLNCRMEKVNSYLWELSHPGSHVNFI